MMGRDCGKSRDENGPGQESEHLRGESEIADVPTGPASTKPNLADPLCTPSQVGVGSMQGESEMRGVVPSFLGVGTIPKAGCVCSRRDGRSCHAAA